MFHYQIKTHGVYTLPAIAHQNHSLPTSINHSSSFTILYMVIHYISHDWSAIIDSLLITIHDSLYDNPYDWSMIMKWLYELLNHDFEFLKLNGDPRNAPRMGAQDCAFGMWSEWEDPRKQGTLRGFSQWQPLVQPRSTSSFWGDQDFLTIGSYGSYSLPIRFMKPWLSMTDFVVA